MYSNNLFKGIQSVKFVGFCNKFKLGIGKNRSRVITKRKCIKLLIRNKVQYSLGKLILNVPIYAQYNG